MQYITKYPKTTEVKRKKNTNHNSNNDDNSNDKWFTNIEWMNEEDENIKIEK